MADPLKSGYIDPNRGWKQLGYPDEIKLAHFIPGRVGGGIIYADIGVLEKWLPGIILTREANCRSPSAVINVLEKLGFRSLYLEPRDQPGAEFGLGKRAKLYLCDPTIEHIESDHDGVYWVVGCKRSARPLKGLADIPTWAQAFDMVVEPLDEIPEPVREETADWFRNPEYEYSWFRINTRNRGAGYNFAVALYISLHLKYVAGPRLRYMHLLAQLESPVNIRCRWPHR